MRGIFVVVATGLGVIVATALSAEAGCNAPYAGCLAACGNKVVGGGGSPGTVSPECKSRCMAKYRECRRACRRGYTC